jgi:hypothetical protein
MATGPGDEGEAAAPGRLRASPADREQVIGTLKAAFVQGVLDKDEFDLRVGQAFTARTCADLAVLTADIPAGLTTVRPPQPIRVPGEQPLRWPGIVLTVVTVAYAAVWPIAFALPDSGPDHDPHAGVALVTTATFFYAIILIMFGTQVLTDWLDRRSGKHPPRRPVAGAGGPASRRLSSADPGRQLPPVDHGHRHTAEAAPTVRPRPLPS